MRGWRAQVGHRAVDGCRRRWCRLTSVCVAVLGMPGAPRARVQRMYVQYCTINSDCPVLWGNRPRWGARGSPQRIPTVASPRQWTPLWLRPDKWTPLSLRPDNGPAVVSPRQWTPPERRPVPLPPPATPLAPNRCMCHQHMTSGHHTCIHHCHGQVVGGASNSQKQERDFLSTCAGSRPSLEDTRADESSSTRPETDIASYARAQRSNQEPRVAKATCLTQRKTARVGGTGFQPRLRWQAHPSPQWP